MYYKWNEKESLFLKTNYPKKGSKYCSDELGIDISKIKGKVQRMRLNLVDKLDVSSFKNIDTRYVAYIMGLIWADGSINNDSCNYSISLESNSDDMSSIKDVIMKTGNWNVYHRRRYRYDKICKESIIYRIGFKKLYEIFENYDFKLKSQKSPFKILDVLKDDTKFYFYRGIIDGDGCFYLNKINCNYQLVISSSFEQDWKYIEDLFQKLKIEKYTIKKIEHKKSKSSFIRISNKKDILKLGNYIYQNYDGIGFKRKYEKYKEIVKDIE